ncbi:DALR anticodon-binding domain-containing protein [Nocardia abscessus]|uniref:DALR anticodon-binding domain-containing protein n=1 Tax=Nocardia abscessus TaxID=120957 RepID=UPI0024559867|nr:DALR anticodon-binding domain-containing protein [Nocardia abscessus]
MARDFTAFYNNCPVLTADEPTRTNRLALCALTARTLAHGLNLLAIKRPTACKPSIQPVTSGTSLRRIASRPLNDVPLAGWIGVPWSVGGVG